MRRATAIAAMLLAAVALALGGCDTDDFDAPADFADLEAVFADAGLVVCSAEDTEARAPGATEERVYEVEPEACEGAEDSTQVVVTAYEDAADRDAAVARYHSQPRPQGVLWTYGPLTVRVTGDRDEEVVDVLTEALDAVGAS
ncbi:MAG: hypothetical protein AB7V62_12185 [Thermoleophilia bacterium]